MSFLRAFSDIPGVGCRKQFRVYRTTIFFINYSENHKIFPGGSMIGRGLPNIYSISGRLAITEAEEI